MASAAAGMLNGGVVTTFAARTEAEDGRTLYSKGEWCANTRSFNLLVITADGEAAGEAAWEATGITQPSNVQYDNWYERAVAALTGIDAESYFTFSFYEDDEEEEEEEGASMTFKWTWHERLSGAASLQRAGSGSFGGGGGAVDDDDDVLLAPPPRLDAPAELKGAKRVGVAKLRRRGTNAESSSSPATQLLAAVMQRNEVGAGSRGGVKCKSVDPQLEMCLGVSTLAPVM
jgi:hypothetical protein